jgi:hypothetical protein
MVKVWIDHNRKVNPVLYRYLPMIDDVVKFPLLHDTIKFEKLTGFYRYHLTRYK